jgi:hypothetical protein
MTRGRGPIVALLLAGAASAAAADDAVVHVFRTLDAETGEVRVETRRATRPGPDGTLEVRFAWESLADGTSGERVYLVEATDHSTREWTARLPHEGTELRGVRSGDGIEITGTRHGEPIEKRVDLDDDLFWSNPFFGMESFVRSGRDRVEFSTLRPDNLTCYGMKASIEGRETIRWAGREVAAVRVKWGLRGFRAPFFRRTIWFRESDGVYLRSQVADGEYTELVEASPGDGSG